MNTVTTEPNWDEAPEGATHWEPRGISAEGWMRLADDGWYFWKPYVGPGWQACNPSKNRILNMISRPWTGAGLPPVGTVCELNGHVHHELRKKPFEWVECTVIAHTDFGGEQIAVAKTVDGSIGWGMPSKFRPIRTPEQIAEEERKAAIEAMAAVMKEARYSAQSTEISPYEMAKAYAAQLYQAGYRKAGEA